MISIYKKQKTLTPESNAGIRARSQKTVSIILRNHSVIIHETTRKITARFCRAAIVPLSFAVYGTSTKLQVCCFKWRSIERPDPHDQCACWYCKWRCHDRSHQHQALYCNDNSPQWVDTRPQVQPDRRAGTYFTSDLLESSRIK